MFCRLALVAFAIPTVAYAQSQRASSSEDVIPADFDGTIVYQGSFTTTTFQEGQFGANRGRMVALAPNSGEATYTLRFSGNQVTGYSSTNVPGVAPVRFTSGTRSGNQCRLNGADGSIYLLLCGLRQLRGNGQGALRTTIRREFKTQLSANATSVVTAAAAAQQKALAEAQVAQQARERVQANIRMAEQARLASTSGAILPAANAPVITTLPSDLKPSISGSRMEGLVGVDRYGNELYMTGVISRKVPEPLYSKSVDIAVNRNALISGREFTPVVVGFVRPPEGRYPQGARFVRVMFDLGSVSHYDIAFVGGKPVCGRRATWTQCDALPPPAAIGRVERERQLREAVRDALTAPFSSPGMQDCGNGVRVSYSVPCPGDR